MTWQFVEPSMGVRAHGIANGTKLNTRTGEANPPKVKRSGFLNFGQNQADVPGRAGDP